LANPLARAPSCAVSPVVERLQTDHATTPPAASHVSNLRPRAAIARVPNSTYQVPFSTIELRAQMVLYARRVPPHVCRAWAPGKLGFRTTGKRLSGDRIARSCWEGGKASNPGASQFARCWEPGGNGSRVGGRGVILCWDENGSTTTWRSRRLGNGVSRRGGGQAFTWRAWSLSASLCKSSADLANCVTVSLCILARSALLSDSLFR